jgi:hypothetical protein
MQERRVDQVASWYALWMTLLLLAAPGALSQPAPEATGMAVQTIPPGQVHGVVGGHVQGSNGLDAGRLWDVLVVTTGYRERR